MDHETWRQIVAACFVTFLFSVVVSVSVSTHFCECCHEPPHIEQTQTVTVEREPTREQMIRHIENQVAHLRETR